MVVLLKGGSIRVDTDTSIKIRPAEVYQDSEGNLIRRPPQLVEVQRSEVDNLSWLYEDSFYEQLELREEIEPQYQQPELSYFNDDTNEYPDWRGF